MGVYDGISMAKPVEQPHPMYAGESPHRVRLPGAIATDLAWPREPDSFDCYGIFRTDGELLCAPTTLITADGSHLFQPALAVRDSVVQGTGFKSLAGFPSTSDLVIDLRVFEFEAKWTTENRAQLDLQLGIRRTSLLGWSRHGSEPLYAIARGGVLALVSADRVRAIQRQAFVDD